MSLNENPSIRAGSVYYHLTRARACRVVKINGDDVHVKFHRDGFTWCSKERVTRGPDGRIVPMDESREYAVVSLIDLAIASREQVEGYLGSKVLHPKKEPKVGI